MKFYMFFVIFFFTILKTLKFTFLRSKNSGVSLKESFLESGSGLDLPKYEIGFQGVINNLRRQRRGREGLAKCLL